MDDRHVVNDAEREHIASFWPRRKQEEFVWTLGPISERLPNFRVRRVAPKDRSDPWVYVTVGAWESTPNDPHGLELVLLSPDEEPLMVELLAMATYLHSDPRYRLDVGRTIDIGRPWVEGSKADHLLVSLPYPFGPNLEHLELAGKHIRFLWLVPITRSEAELVRTGGLESFEQLLERDGVDVLDPARLAVAP